LFAGCGFCALRLAATVTQHLNETLKIKIGKELPMINQIGAYISLFGILLFLITGVILFAGVYLPLEMKLIYFVEIIHRNIYLTFLSSILIFIIGSVLGELKNFYETDLKITDEGLEFYKDQEKIELPNRKIHKLIKRRNYLISDKKITIKTIGLKKIRSPNERPKL